MNQQGSPFIIGARVIVRSTGQSDLAVGTLRDVQPQRWTVELAESIEPGCFEPGDELMISTNAAGGLVSARTQLLRRSLGTFVVARPHGQDHRDRRRDARLPASGVVGWSSRGLNGMAQVVDVSRSGMKVAAGSVLRVGESVILDVGECALVSAMVVAVTKGDVEGCAHLAFTRISDAQRDAVVDAVARADGGEIDIDLTGPLVLDLPA